MIIRLDERQRQRQDTKHLTRYTKDNKTIDEKPKTNNKTPCQIVESSDRVIYYQIRNRLRILPFDFIKEYHKYLHSS